MNPAQFIAKWSRVDLPERAASQEHFLDLCRLLGQPTPAEHDATGAEYTFEKGVAVTAGASRGARGDFGYADVWWRGKFAWEYKRKDKYKDLADAYRQLCQYREALENPPLLVVSDITRTEIHTNFTGTAKQVHVVRLEDLDKPPSLALLRRLFTAPDTFRPTITPEKVTEEIAEHVAQIARSLQDRGHDPHTAAHFLMKCMFCLFAEDVGLLPEKLFSRLLAQWRDRPRELTARLTDLFATMRCGGAFGAERIAYFNGGLFDESPALKLEEPEAKDLLVAAKQDWGSVEPAIFGTLFERSLDPGKRAQIGAHYTSRDDILLVVEPVVMAPLRRQWQGVKDEVEGHLARRRAAKSAATRRKADAAIQKAIQDYFHRLGTVRILDPACGSGNFLYVAIQQLLDLEKEVITFAARQDIGLNLFPTVRPTQLHGIELNAYAAELAQVVIWIGYLQWMRDNGFVAPSDPILEPLQTIECRDAIVTSPSPSIDMSSSAPSAGGASCVAQRGSAGMANTASQSEAPEGASPVGAAQDAPSGADGTDSPASVPSAAALGYARRRSAAEDGAANAGADSTARPAQWPEADFIIGNPPFLGSKLFRLSGLPDEYVQAMYEAFDLPKSSDLCCYWFELARREIERRPHVRAGLLATQGIRGGANRTVLQRIKETGDIFMAWADRDWILDGANVHVSIIGFDSGHETQRALDGAAVQTINADLSCDVDTAEAKRLPENFNLAFMGTTKGGAFDIEWAEVRHLLSLPNPHSKPNLDVVRPWVNGMDITRRNRGMWIVDFGCDVPLADAAKYEAPFHLLEQRVKPERIRNRRAAYAEKWWLHVEARPAMREALGDAPYIVTPILTKYRLFVHLRNAVLPDHQLIVFARSDDYFFGVLHSSIHELWARRMGTQLREAESGFRYTPTTCFETFPLPWPPGQEPQETPTGSGPSVGPAVLSAGGAPCVAQRGSAGLTDALGEAGAPDGASSPTPPPDAPSGAAPSAPQSTVPSAPALGYARHRSAVDRIAEAARILNDQRERWLNPPEWIEPIARAVDLEEDFSDVPEAARDLIRQSAIMAKAAKDPNLKKRTLTNLYNERPTWLRLAHLELDRAVLAAYAQVDPDGGWDEAWAEVWEATGAGQPLPDGHALAARRAEVDQKVLANLLRLNLARA